MTRRDLSNVYLRSAYLNRQCTHEQYYGQFVTERILNIVSVRFPIKTLVEEYHKDEHFNTIPMHIWDALTGLFSCTYPMLEVGDYSTLAGKVCILKEAARQLVEMEKNHETR